MTKSQLVYEKNLNHGKIKVTIGICIRNEEKTIKRTMESIIRQDFPHELMEVIIVDDGSEDNTLQVVLDFAREMHMNVRVFHSSWKGLGPARNQVVTNARGDYIIWVDGGTVLPRDHVRKQIEFMERHPNIGIAKARCAALEEKNIVSILEDLQYRAYDFRYSGKVNSFVLGTCGATYRTRAIREIGGFDNSFKGSGEDFDVECRMREKGWLLYRTSAIFFREHLRTWKSIWNEGLKYGYGGCYTIRKYKWKVLKRLLLSILDGLINAKTAYVLTRRKIAFLLIFHHAFKKLAWFFGFLKYHLECLTLRGN